MGAPMDRRERQIPALLRQLENDCPPHVLQRVDEQLRAALAAQPDDTRDVTVSLPDLHHARVSIRGLPPTTPTLMQRAKSMVKAKLKN